MLVKAYASGASLDILCLPPAQCSKPAWEPSNTTPMQSHDARGEKGFCRHSFKMVLFHFMSWTTSAKPPCCENLATSKKSITLCSETPVILLMFLHC